MTKLQKRFNTIITIVLIICAIVCCAVVVQLIRGKDASIFGYRVYHIVTGSMEPTIPTGSNVLVRETDPYKLEEGDIITFTSRDPSIEGQANTHRILDVTEDEAGNLMYVTKGDANNSADHFGVYPSDIKGKVVFHVNSSAFSTFFDFVHTKNGFVTVIVLPVMFLLWLFIQDFRRQLVNMEKTAAAEAAAVQTETEKKMTDTASEEKPEEKSEE